MSTIHKTSPYALFETDKDVEQKGVRLDYGPFYFQVARAGGANTRFRDTLRQRMAPHKRAMATDTMNDELQEKIGMDVFCETVILGWGSEEFGEGKIAGRDGKPVTFSVEAVKAMFKDLPDLARDVFAQAQSTAMFRAAIAELDAGN
jgi:hypothetical protein